MNAIKSNPTYAALIEAGLTNTLTETYFSVGKRYQGKVRDTYDLGDQLLLVTTDRQSAFDRVLASIPYKGQVLNLTSAWWFEQTADLVPNHMIALPDQNVMVAKKCDVFPIEFIVRGYITGTTNTSLWTQYQKGVRHYCGIDFPEGLVKNTKLATPVLTPTTKETHQDRPISPTDIIKEGWMNAEDFEQASAYAMTLFQKGTELAKEHGLILVDTKYEFGKDRDGNIVIVDELHTPDSSRYWLAHNYQERITNGLEPENIDKEFLRLWFKEHCDPYQADPLPAAPKELVIKLAERYIQLYEMITRLPFSFTDPSIKAEERILRNIAGYL